MNLYPQPNLIVLGLSKRQPLWVILYRLPEKGRKEIVEMKKKDREETEELETLPLYPYLLQG